MCRSWTRFSPLPRSGAEDGEEDEVTPAWAFFALAVVVVTVVFCVLALAFAARRRAWNEWMRRNGFDAPTKHPHETDAEFKKRILAYWPTRREGGDHE